MAKFISSRTFYLLAILSISLLLAISNVDGTGRHGQQDLREEPESSAENLEFRASVRSYVDTEISSRETIFINKDQFNIIKATKAFRLSSQKKVQYFEAKLIARWNDEPKPMSIELRGNLIRDEYRPYMQVGDRIGGGIVYSSDGKFYDFFTLNGKLIHVYNLDKADERFKHGMFPTIVLFEEGTEISIKKNGRYANAPPSLDELEQKIAQFEEKQPSAPSSPTSPENGQKSKKQRIH